MPGSSFRRPFSGADFRQQELLPTGAGDDFPGGREEPVAPAFDVPGFGVMTVLEGRELDPGDQVEGEDCDVRPGQVRGEIKERYLEPFMSIRV